MKKLRLEIEQLEVESFGTVEDGEDGRGTVRGLATSVTGCATGCGEAGCETVGANCGTGPDAACPVEEYSSFFARVDEPDIC
jgi:hypothetical protein